MQQSYDYDAIVIGSGPGGEGAAMGLVKQGARIAVIERYHNIGGGCTHWGTIPSKALRHAVSRIIEFNQNPLYSDHTRLLRSSFADILNHTENVISQQTHMRQGFYERNHCELFQGDARFIDANTIEIESHDGSIERLTAGKFVIACGSRPYHPPDVDFTHPRVYDSDSILNLHHEPGHVIIYGAGVIGCEYAMTTGVLQAIPNDLYEAATMDGASTWKKLKTITLPLVLYSIAPIIITQYTFNFNNFNIIYLFNNGGPAVAGSNAGGTDILVSWIYKLTMSSSQYAIAATITILLSIFVVGIALWQFRSTNSFKQDDMA